ncbi:Cyclic nucleotide-binding domain [Popillia japonica]|uniref:Cyclic nucleotide-binding domain n=1 Tax=Popillia japonica TaxID=7064 RepID=A0AAW1IXY5_POPJA
MSKLDRSNLLMAQDSEIRIIRARRRFKAVVRLVIANKPWLEDDQDGQLSRNVKKNVQLLTRKKAKKGLLTLQQKAILCKPAEFRTEEEKVLLNRIIGGLKCFRKYPEHVKMQLAGVTYFMYFGPNRMIVRQNHEAHALYFLLTGEVAVSITTYDPVIQEKVTINVGTMVAGSMFGEVSLLHDIPRTATITTITACELLCLKKADFDIVLKASVKQQWHEIQTAMSKFEYFNGWDEVAVRECDGQGIPSSVYFILKGRCKIIEHLLVKSRYNGQGRKLYKMYEPGRENMGEEEESKTLLDEMKHSLASLMSEPKNMGEEEESKTLLDEMKHSLASLMSEPRISALPIDLVESDTSVPSRKSIRPIDTESRASISTTSSRRTRASIGSTLRRKTVTSEEDHLSTRECSAKVARIRPLISFKDELVTPSVIDLPRNVETHFMQVCILSEKACFGLGENMKRRRVVAMSDYVECLLIPRYWLLQHNRGNVWTRIQQYLNNQIPSTKTVFQEFLNERKWLRHRQNLAQQLFKRPPVTAPYHIPYSIRINEGALSWTTEWEVCESLNHDYDEKRFGVSMCTCEIGDEDVGREEKRSDPSLYGATGSYRHPSPPPMTSDHTFSAFVIRVLKFRSRSFPTPTYHIKWMFTEELKSTKGEENDGMVSPKKPINFSLTKG